jgi:regulator of replication initiation timing
MIKDRMCREYLEEIERLERSIVELEEELIELRMQLRLKVEEANDLAIENANLRHKLELMEKREKYLMNILQKLKVPLVLVDEDEFEDIDVSE